MLAPTALATCSRAEMFCFSYVVFSLQPCQEGVIGALNFNSRSHSQFSTSICTDFVMYVFNPG